MDCPCPPLAPKLAVVIDALRADGCFPTDAELVWLGRLRWACDHPQDGSVAMLPGAPVVHCGVTFWPINGQGRAWYRRALALTADGGDDSVWLRIFTAAHCKPGDKTLVRLSTAGQIREAVDEWIDNLPIPARDTYQVCEAVLIMDGDSSCVPNPNPTDADASDSNILGFAGTMMQQFPGTTVDYWTCQISEREVEELCDSATGKAGWATSSKRLTAIEQFQRAVKWIRMAHNE